MLAYFRLKFEHRYTVPQVIFALEKYTDLKNDIPAPADILAILNPPLPEKPRITEAQYIQACKAQEKNGYPAFSTEYMLIQEYKKQNDEAVSEHKAALIAHNPARLMIESTVAKMKEIGHE